MQTIWSRVAQSSASCQCPSRNLAAGALTRHKTTTTGCRRIKFADAVTLFYTSIFGIAAIADAQLKDDRRDDWDKKIAAVKEDIQASKERTAELLKSRASESDSQKSLTVNLSLSSHLLNSGLSQNALQLLDDSGITQFRKSLRNDDSELMTRWQETLHALSEIKPEKYEKEGQEILEGEVEGSPSNNELQYGVIEAGTEATQHASQGPSSTENSYLMAEHHRPLRVRLVRSSQDRRREKSVFYLRSGGASKPEHQRDGNISKWHEKSKVFETGLGPDAAPSILDISNEMIFPEDRKDIDEIAVKKNTILGQTDTSTRQTVKGLVTAKMVVKLLLLLDRPQKPYEPPYRFYDRPPVLKQRPLYLEEREVLVLRLKYFNKLLYKQNKVGLNNEARRLLGSYRPTYQFLPQNARREKLRELNTSLREVFKEFNLRPGTVEDLLLQICSLLLESKVAPSRSTLRILLQNLRMLRLNAMVHVVQETILELGWKYDNCLAGTLLRFYIKTNNKSAFDGCLQLLKDNEFADEPWVETEVGNIPLVVPPKHDGSFAGNGIFGALIEGMLKFGHPQKAVALFNIMLQRGVEPGRPLLVLFLKYSACSQLWRWGQDLCAQINRFKHAHNAHTYYWMLWLCYHCRQWGEYERILEEAIESRVHPRDLKFFVSDDAWTNVSVLKEWKEAMEAEPVLRAKLRRARNVKRTRDTEQRRIGHLRLGLSEFPPVHTSLSLSVLAV
ncbi:MAG: hypothetical protein M1834_004200 [Cirrosporium novae-zelandiae]|nr:MAG: hypothetical protein M1834_004200 [Cirrosporium novae-zelandiae]